MGLPRPRRIDPVRQSPRSLMFGFFTHGTVHLNHLNSLVFCLAPTVIVRLAVPEPLRSPVITIALPSPARRRSSRSRGFHRASSVPLGRSDYSPSIASLFAYAYRVTYCGAFHSLGQFS